MVAQTEIEVRVTRMPIRIVKVVFKGGYHLIVGGRLLSAVNRGVTTQYPDMPAYTPADFPVDFIGWSDGKVGQDVEVREIHPGGGIRKLSVVRACTMLFTALEASVVRSWVTKGGGK